ncbi:Benzylsuccinate synthase alpha subunit [uncultured Desulfobacterium sp.]|uniref:Benzylsuccinate synthase alpha subunit n=1 Tax=uncultured Desulfobacterium sp. TaxID=201089 RepID=A0A445MYT8_9BACT|nr:Benzylsuccinate synthase alpha subunit [uncultured Desulfobacterium sp.]
MPITERTKRLKDRCRWKHFMGGDFIDPNTKVGVERMRYFTESYRETMGEPEVIRRAKALDKLLRNMTIVIQEDELVVGDHAEHPDWVPLWPELGHFQFLDFIDSEYFPEGHEEEVEECYKFWENIGQQKKGEAFCTPQELNGPYQFNPVEPPTFTGASTSMTPPYESVLEDGLEKRIEEAQKKVDDAMRELSTPPWNSKEKLKYLPLIDEWKAMVIAGKAVIAWARRYSRLAKVIAERFEKDEKRKAELMEISDICWRVPAQPAKGLRDAMQAKWFTYLVCASLETYASGYGQKEDRLLWPYYKTSVIDKTFQPMTRDDAQELVECERLKVSEHGVAKGRTYRTNQPGANDLFILTVGGLDEHDEDDCTEATDVILDAAHSIRTTEPSIVFRWHPKINEETKRHVHKCVSSGLGYPSIKHEDINTAQLEKYFGATHAEARSWGVVLCMSPGITGRRKTQKTRTEGGGGTMNIAKILELTLSNGFDYSFQNEQVAPQTGAPLSFKGFEDFWEAFRQQIYYWSFVVGKFKDISRYMESTTMQRPFTSLIDDGCLEKGIDAMALQEVPNPWNNVTAVITAADAVAGLKKLVYDEKKYTMEQLIKAMRVDWEGYEQMRQDFLAVPKFGNDNAYVDQVARDLFHMISEEMQKHKLWAGCGALPLAQSVSLFTVLAPRVGALPNGRRHGEVLDDGGISPCLGRDIKGPTAVMKSVATVDATEHKGLLLNQRISPDIMNGTAGFEIWKAYMEAWYGLNIDHVQFNVVSTEEMRDAQVQPEDHRDLLVRVAGYSARFVDLTTFTQESVIARTEHCL